MAEIIRMPRMSDTMEEGNIVEWLKKVGDAVEPGDVLAEVETDKATMELESYHEGVLLHIGVAEGPVPVNGILAVIGEKGEDFEAQLKEAEASKPDAEQASEEPAPKSESAESEEDTTPKSDAPAEKKPDMSQAESDAHIKASPLAKSMADSKNIDLTNVTGSGEGGRIIKRDIEEYVPSFAASSAGSAVPAPMLSQTVQYGEQPISQMRKTIAKRLAESKFGAPHFYLTVEINMDKSITARQDINQDPDIKISFNDLVVKASAAALRKHPNINASWLGDKIKVHEEVNIGVAVAVPDGLVVPVVRSADVKPLTMINAEVKELAGKARNKKLTPQEMQGNTFTISNLGMFGIEEFTAIINPPDACILAVGSIIPKPVVVDGEIKAASIMKVTLSCDHRIVDGASGAQFLNTLRSFLENPVRILA